MGIIKLLAPEVVNQIAAGEVVERPVSVVKELLENAIDAAATQITVVIEDAGLKEIRVIDNGMGMTGEDAELAIARHATSKIRNAGDLDRVATLGFRGEALAAIASVSRLTLITRTAEMIAGTRIVVEGGEKKQVTSIGCPHGTQVIVRDLFFNSPPRRKFLKSIQAEKAAVADLLSRFALGYPEIALNFYSGKRLSLATPGQAEPIEIACILYGKEAKDNFLEIFYEGEGVRIRGIVSKPQFTRASRHYQTFFVNRRLVRNYHLSRALESAYEGLVTSGHYPCVAIYLDLEPKTIDVNVHPTKSDIRFADPALVARALYRAVRNTLANYQTQRRLSHQLLVEHKNHSSVHSLPGNGFNNWRNESAVCESAPLFYKPESECRQPFFREMRLIGQAQGLYIIAEKGDNIFIIDQHAAHERIRYEEIMKNMERSECFAQKLSVPQEVRLSPEERIIYLDNKDLLKGVGYELKEAGTSSFLIISVPPGLNDDPGQLFREMLEVLRQERGIRENPMKFYEKVAMMSACKSAVKAGDILTTGEMRAILQQLDDTANPDNCPHGRPTYIRLAKSELDKRFFR